VKEGEAGEGEEELTQILLVILHLISLLPAAGLGIAPVLSLRRAIAGETARLLLEPNGTCER